MKVKFKVNGLVALNYGVDGTIEVKKDEVRDLSEAHGLALCKENIAEQVEFFGKKEPAKEELIEKPAEKKAEEPKEELPVEKPVEEKAPAKKRGRPSKKKAKK